MIRFEDLTYSYRNGKEALRNITADIAPGIHLLLGENGAGKTTLLHIVDGLLLATPQGSCTIDGKPTALRMPEVLQRVFFVSDNMSFPYPTVNDMVRCHAPFYPNFSEDILRHNLATFSMTGEERIDSFSLGNRKKAILSYALALKPDILLLDEPANGLDIGAKQVVLSLMAECVDETQTVILSTHTVSDFQSLFDSVMVLSGGNLVLNASVWGIAEKWDFVQVPTPPEEAVYVEPFFGQFRAIIPHRGESPATEVDFTLLYNALQMPNSRHIIMNSL